MIHSFPRRAAIIGVILAASSTMAFSATVQPAPPADAATDETALCSSLATEWKTAEAACTTNANLGRARALAREAETKCKSPEATQRKLGLSKYQSALRLCRKPGGAP